MQRHRALLAFSWVNMTDRREFSVYYCATDAVCEVFGEEGHGNVNSVNWEMLDEQTLLDGLSDYGREMIQFFVDEDMDPVLMLCIYDRMRVFIRDIGATTPEDLMQWLGFAIQQAELPSAVEGKDYSRVLFYDRVLSFLRDYKEATIYLGCVALADHELAEELKRARSAVKEGMGWGSVAEG